MIIILEGGVIFISHIVLKLFRRNNLSYPHYVFSFTYHRQHSTACTRNFFFRPHRYLFIKVPRELSYNKIIKSHKRNRWKFSTLIVSVIKLSKILKMRTARKIYLICQTTFSQVTDLHLQHEREQNCVFIPKVLITFTQYYVLRYDIGVLILRPTRDWSQTLNSRDRVFIIKRFTFLAQRMFIEHVT